MHLSWQNIVTSIRFALAVHVLATVSGLKAEAQFKDEAFTQTYADPNDTTMRDSTDTMFSIKEYFGGLAHKNNLKIGTMFAGSTVFIGGGQIYNKQYWKLPIIYSGIGAGVGLGTYYEIRYKKSVKAYEAALEEDPKTELTPDKKAHTGAILSFAGAALFYWGALMDATVNYDRSAGRIQPGRSTIYSILVPGLGQINNGEYWKIPIYWGGLAAAGHFLYLNNVNYHRFKQRHNEATTPGSGYSGPYGAETALYYRDVYRRYRDYSIVALAAVYLLQVIDANVFAYMQDFEVSDDITLKVSPTLISPENNYAFVPEKFLSPGLKLSLRF